MFGRRVVATITAFVTAVTISAVRPVSASADSDTDAQAVASFLSAPTNSIQSWSKGLGQIGKLAEALPAVQTSPGAALGFGDLLDKAFTLGGVKGAMNDGDLTFNDKPIDLGDGRSGHLTSHVVNNGEGKHVLVDAHITRDLLDQPLSVPVPIGSGSNAPQSAFTSTGGVKLTVTADLSFEAVHQTLTNKVYLKVVSSGLDATPVLKVGATAVIGNVTGVAASVGILGVSLVNDSSLDVAANFIATVSDPNNDGRLYFEDPSENPGELAQDGSLAGLVSFGLDSPAGHFNASLHMTATANSSFSLPAVDATLGVSWPDISAGTPTVTFPDASVGQFLNMTPRDLAVGIAQLVTSLTSIQSAKSKTDTHFGNVNLPFLKGTLADAVKINESLQKFLQDWTFPGPSDPNFQPGVDDPAKAGEPKFTSLQTFIDKLNSVLASTGGAITGVGFDNDDPGTHMLHFTLGLHHDAPADPVNLNGASAASSGPASSPGNPANTTYTTTGLSDSNQDWKPNEFAGRQVVAGNSAATIASNDAHSLTLATNVDGSHWSPAVPTANQPYAISGMQGDVGQVQLGNELQTPDADPTKPGHGVANANAVNSSAKVSPSFDVSVTLVLDLTPPIIHDPPIAKTNPDGSTFLVSSEPTGADRVKLRTDTGTPLFTADFPIDASADIFANAGFLQVELNGGVHVCQKEIATADCSGAPPAGKHMVEVDLVPQNDITFGQLVKELIDDPTQLIEYHVAVRAVGSVKASIPGASDFFGVDPDVGFHWNDLTVFDPNDADGPVVDFSALDRLAKVDFDPSNPRALFGIILKTLQTLNTVIGSSPTSEPAKSIFGTKIPVLGRSLGDLLAADESGAGDGITFGASALTDASRSDANGNSFDPDVLVGRSVVVGTQAGIITGVSDDTLTFAAPWPAKPADGSSYVVRSQLDDAITILENSPSDNLQALTKLLNDRLGHSSPITFVYDDGSHVDNKPSIIIKLNWHREYHTSAPIKFDFDLGGTHSVAGLQGSGSVSLGVSGDITMGLVVSLESGDGPGSGATLKILDDSGINLNLDAEAHGALTTTIGPLSLSLGNPEAGAPAEEKINAQAHYGLGLGKSSPTGDAVSFDSFLGAVGPTVNSGPATADCGFGDSVDLALCADLPLFVKGNGNNYTKLITAAGASNDFQIRLPKQPHNTPDLTDVIDPLGDDIGGHPRIETPDPTEFANALAAATLDLTRIDGIDSFLNALQNALITASFGGKLPLVGDDIQQGADFIGQLKTQIDAVLGDLASVNSTSGLSDWLNDHLKAGLQSAGLNPDLVRLDIECTDILDTVATPTVELVNDPADAATTTYTYVVASYVKDSSGAIHQAKASDPGEITNGPDPDAGDGVSPSKPLKISWTGVTGADGYLVFRKDGGTFKQIADVGASTATDDGTATPGASPTNPAENPHLHDCSLDHFDSFIIRVDVSQGDFSGDYLNCDPPVAGHDCLSQDVPINIGLPGLSLRSASDTDKLKVQIGWRLHLAFGISKTDGFFVDTKDGDPQPELAVGLNVKLPAHMKAQLAIIDVDLSNCTKDDTVNCDPATAPDASNIPPLFGGSFKLDVTSPHANGRLTFADLGSAQISDLVHPKLTAGVNIDWLLKATVDEGAGFPGIQTEFQLKWAWTNADPGSGAGTDLTIAFQKVQISAGKILGQVLGPIIQQIKKVTDPLQPVIKTLYAPIPVLSDLSHLVGGDDITLVSIAKAFSTIAGGPDLTFVDRVVEVVKLVSALPVGDDDVLIPIGSFQVAGSKAVDTTATPDNSESLIKTGSKTLSGDASTDTSLLDALDDKTTSGTRVLNTEDGDGKTESEKAGFSFPVFQHPASLFNLLLGGDVDLVKFDSGPLTLGFDWRQEFGPVYAPPPVLITLHGSASVTLHVVAGFDTYGIRKAIEKVRDGTFEGADVGEAILQSLFFYTNDDSGKPIPVVQFNGEIAAGAEVSVVIITVGIEGGVGLTISFLWNDPNHDGKFRLSEFLKVALNNPICLFSVSGRIYVFLKLFVKIGFGPFSVSFSFTIVDVTLLDFTVTPNCDPPPPKLGGLGDGGKTLVVYAGTLGTTAHRGDPAWDSGAEDKETIKITSLHDYDSSGNATFKGVAVEMLGIRNEFLNSSIEKVVVDGHTYDKPMTVTFIGDGKEDTARTGDKPPTANFEKDAIVFGGSAADKIKTGIGDSYVDGGGGNDAIATGDRTVSVHDEGTNTWSYVNPNAKAWVAGGDGDDSITVGNGPDRVSGDGKLGYTPVDVTDVKELKNSKNESDNETSANPGVARGNIPIPDQTKFDEPSASESGLTAGKDVLSTGLGLSKVYGNAGDDTLSAAPDNDLVKTVTSPAQKALFHSAGAVLVGGTGNDNLAGGAGDDTIDTGPDAGGLTADPDANGGADDGSTNVVDTGTGTDKVYGSTGVDLVTGHSKQNQVDDIRGGSGNDILIGGYGQDTVFGGPDNDYVVAEPSTVDPVGSAPPDGIFGPLRTVTHTPLPEGTAPSSKTLVGGTGDDHIVGGDGGAAIDGDGYNSTDRCGSHGPGWATESDPVDESVNTASDGNDKIIGGAGIENVRAGGGNDLVDVKASNDLACGESGADTLTGGTQDDKLWGGTGADVEYGDADADKLYGNDQADAIYGGLQSDFVEGNGDSDFASGGEGDDIVLGGTRDAGRGDDGDVLNGDNGTDTIIGDNGDNVGGKWHPLDLNGLNASYGGKDSIFGGNNDDLGYGGLDDDTMLAGSGEDHFEGNNADDTMFGEAGEDELVGGGRFSPGGNVGYSDGVDTISGGTGADVITGDNAVVNGNNETAVAVADSTDVLRGRGFTKGHTVALLDLGYSPTGANSAGDVLHGNDNTDAIFGQGGGDAITGDNGEDYAEGGPGVDTIDGNDGEDDLVGGSSTKDSTPPDVGQPDTGDVIHGDADADVVIGDNGKVLRSAAGLPLSPITDRAGMTNQRSIVLYDLSPAAASAAFGDDLVTGDAGVDVILGQAGNDRLKGNADGDYVEGDQGSDFVEGDTGDDDLVGGSSTVRSGTNPAIVGQADTDDAVYGGPGDDAVIGDNGSLLRVGDRTATFNRISSTSPGSLIVSRNLVLYDLNGPTYPSLVVGGNSGNDRVSGGDDVDVVYGQDGDDQISGGSKSDYIEGNGGNDLIQGDRPLFTPAPIVGQPVTTQLGTSWPGTASGPDDLEGTSADGQDDMLGGSSIANFRDGNDNIEGDGEGDFQLGDNGVLRRDLVGIAPNLTDRIFAKRYATPAPANAVAIRIGDTSVNPNGTTRFCTIAQTTCEMANAFGDDTMWGDGGDDTQWGQDGNDLMRGGNGDDNMYGELGNDQMWGEAGDDAMLGDRGGVVDQYENGDRHYAIDVNQVPKVHYDGFATGTVTRQTDLQHDINGDVFVGSSTDPKMPHPGDVQGGNDRIRGGTDEDFVHAGFGDDLVNGDSGGDTVFGDDGADVMWGGKGCDAQIAVDAAALECKTNGAFDPNARGTNDRKVDYLLGGKGASSGPSVDPNTGDFGSDILDWHPRGVYSTTVHDATTCTLSPWPQTFGNGKKNNPVVTIDPCSWFEMTNLDDASVLDNQHHQGIDWQYGGWDRDVLQGDVADNGPNDGDRLLDWNGTYNLYTHCNSAYGGYNDVRQHSPDWQAFLQKWVFSLGAGQLATDSANGTAGVGTSAFDELALVYPGGDNAHGSGSAFPSTPGHFDDPNACAP
jgi:Ca2+-binding RTX toxin-like protein